MLGGAYPSSRGVQNVIVSHLWESLINSYIRAELMRMEGRRTRADSFAKVALVTQSGRVPSL